MHWCMLKRIWISVTVLLNARRQASRRTELSITLSCWETLRSPLRADRNSAI